MTSQIEIHTIAIDGAVAVITSPERFNIYQTRVHAKLADLDKRIESTKLTIETTRIAERKAELEEELPKLEAEREALADTLESTQTKYDALRKSFKDSIEILKFPFRPYTWGEKCDAEAECTSYDDGEPKIDLIKFHTALAVVSTGKSVDEIRGLAPQVAQTLISEVLDRSEPDPNRLDFLAAPRSS